jgi:plasmid maintenance system killer protein
LNDPRALKLDRMEAAASLRDLAALPWNRFEALVSDRKGQYSIRINDHLLRVGRPIAGDVQRGDC